MTKISQILKTVEMSFKFKAVSLNTETVFRILKLRRAILMQGRWYRSSRVSC